MEDIIEIRSIQFKRGKKLTLETKLVGNNKLKAGEPAYETDTKKLKIGDGIHDYHELEYALIDQNDLDRAVQAAQRAAIDANTARSMAESAKIEAEDAVDRAEEALNAAKAAFQKIVDDKFWHGTIDDYAKLSDIDPDRFYFIEY